METKKVLIKTAYCLVGLSFVVLIGIIIFQQQQIKQLSGGVTSETVTKDETPGEATPVPVETLQKSTTQKTTTASKDIDDLEYQLNAAEEELDMAHEQLSEELNKQAEMEETRKQLQDKVLADPAIQKRARAAAKATMDITLGPLFEMLDLSPEKIDELKDLLVDQQMGIRDIAPFVGGAISEEQKAEIQKRFDDNREEYKIKITGFLGEEKYNKFESYNESLQERITLNDFMVSLPLENKVDEDQSEILINSMYEVRKEISKEMGYDDKKIVFPSELNEEKIDYLLELSTRVGERYTDVISDVLPPEQIEQFKDFFKQRLDLAETSLQMTAQAHKSRPAQERADEASE